ncbi:flagellar hook-associated protein FlgL [Noviherbaspirillum galbum]|uniref:Flagellar hook-associated protein 3 n=1 Tax=Noviherbaspirillum galbum TaxID=2709383 RepID=A0A6B3STL1_9BURK|nr:flagellar hook-associated protein FlgL [Noviherbaspirillum galbum]NEX62685.1 flagellar hook-associated protein 3 [Noviherbaspirillum galbum]
MRISTNVLFDSGAARIGNLQNSLNRTQQQLSSGKRILNPSDDPVAAAQAVNVTQSQVINDQLAVNRGSARNSLNVEESVLGNITSLLQDVKTAVIQAGNGSLDDQQRGFIATELQGRLDDLIGLANTVDGGGNQLFGGYQTSKDAFIKTAAGADFIGDEGARMLQVGPGRQLAVSDSGARIFLRSKTGNGNFVASAANVSGVPSNTGSGVIGTGTVTNAAALTGHQYSITFTSATTFDIQDVSAGTTVSSGNAYASGQSITFDGMQISIEGSPATNDAFTIKPSSSASIFGTMSDLVNLLKKPVATPADGANLRNGLRSAQNIVDNTLDNVMTVRADVGSRLKELDSLDAQGDDRKAQYAESLQNLQELDYTDAVTRLSKEKIMLEAVQQSFAQTSGLSLFNYLK